MPYVYKDAHSPRSDGPGLVRLCVSQETDAESLVRSFVPSKPMTARIFTNGQLKDACQNAIRRTDTLHDGATVTLDLVVTRTPGKQSATPVHVLYQDCFLLAVEKPTGILVHGDGGVAETLSDRVQGLLARQNSVAVPQALHRLDVDTSGIVLFSLTEELQPAFDVLFSRSDGQKKGLQKRYYAVVEGRLPWRDEAWHTVEVPLARDRHDARRMRASKAGKHAVTSFRTVERRGAYSLVEAELHTGRKHQIRVHLSSLGNPIVGDTLYGGRHTKHGLLLHAHELRFIHPLTQEPLLLTSPLPERFCSFKNAVGE